jgi:hypothetical protein
MSSRRRSPNITLHFEAGEYPWVWVGLLVRLKIRGDILMCGLRVERGGRSWRAVHADLRASGLKLFAGGSDGGLRIVTVAAAIVAAFAAATTEGRNWHCQDDPA